MKASDESLRRRGMNVKVCLTVRDEGVLAYAWRFRLLTRDQVMALAPFGSLTRANTRLAALVRMRLLRRKHLPIIPGNGSAQALYYPGAAIGPHLTADGDAVRNCIRQVSRWDERQVNHVRAANQVLVDVIQAGRNMQDGNLISFRTEPELREVFVNRPLVPDGWFSWTMADRRFNCFLELDLHTEGLTQWREKVLTYVQYALSGAHEERFGFQCFRVLVVAQTQKRLEHLRKIAVEAGRLFLFAEARTLSSETLFGPVWSPASGDRLISLSEA